ncbi:alpha/beta-hydrolase [Amylocystis lapponica]|nr:alpha/beta-hydrolase [Amylocystis lapponica]
MSDDPTLSSAGVQAIPTLFDPATCTRKGMCLVTEMGVKGDPFESHSLYFEQHGTGPEKILFIMGLNGTLWSWYNQVEYFGRKPEYSVLVFDNRGVGNSGTPRGPYTTSRMADDVIALLDYVGWTAEHDLHVVGVSLGGMIAQELATKIAERIISLTLTVTRARRGLLTWLPSLQGCYALAKAMVITDRPKKIPILLDMLFPQDWLDAKNSDDAQGRTNRELQTMEYIRRFDVVPPQQLMGSVSQMAAATTHNVSPERLHSISASVPKVLILTGTKDQLVHPSGSRWLAQNMPEAEFVEWEGAEHGLAAQLKDRYNETLERVFREGRERLANRQQVVAA